MQMRYGLCSVQTSLGARPIANRPQDSGGTTICYGSGSKYDNYYFPANKIFFTATSFCYIE